MINSILFMNLNPTPQNDNQHSKRENTFLEFAKIVFAKGNFTRGQKFYLIFTLIYLAFYLILALPSKVIYVFAIIFGAELNEIPTPSIVEPLSIGIIIIFVIGVIYFILYSIPELIERFSKKEK